MRKILFPVLIFSMLLLCAGATLYSSSLCGNISSLLRTNTIAAAYGDVIEYEVDDRFEEDGGGGNYSNGLPGPQGQRRLQPVRCEYNSAFSEWKVKEACCFGEENCSTNNCAKKGEVSGFSCDNHHWLLPPGHEGNLPPGGILGDGD